MQKMLFQTKDIKPIVAKKFRALERRRPRSRGGRRGRKRRRGEMGEAFGGDDGGDGGGGGRFLGGGGREGAARIVTRVREEG